jgi:hypothetical protein
MKFEDRELRMEDGEARTGVRGRSPGRWCGTVGSLAQSGDGARRLRRFNVAGKRVLKIFSLPLLSTLKRHKCRAPGSWGVCLPIARFSIRANFFELKSGQAQHFLGYSHLFPAIPAYSRKRGVKKLKHGAAKCGRVAGGKRGESPRNIA